MAFDDDETDDEAAPSTPLPLDDRLWRHPSELARVSPLPPAAAPSGPPGPTRALAVAALASACLAGAVVAVGAMWVTRPTRVVVGDAAPTTAAPVSAAMFTPAGTGADALADRTAPSLATLHVEQAGSWSKATAIWLDDEGGAVVAAPVVDGAEALVMVGDDGARQRAELIAVDEATGIAVVEVARTAGVPTARATAVGRSGALVAVIGATLPSRDDEPSPRFVSAAISAVGVRTSVGEVVLHDALELDRAVPADAAGGAVVDQSGDLLAIVVSTGTGSELAVAIPAAAAMESARALRTHGEVRRGWLGVQAVDLDPDLAESLTLRGGALLTAVQPASPAVDGGLQQGDVVVRVDDRAIDDASDLVLALRGTSPDATVEIGWLRDGAEMAAPVTLGDGGGG